MLTIPIFILWIFAAIYAGRRFTQMTAMTTDAGAAQ